MGTRTRMTRRMVMKMLKMTNVNGKTGVSGLVNAAHSLADVLAVKLVAGPLRTSCLIRAAVDSSVQDGKLKPGPAKKKIVAKMPMMVRMRRTALMMRTRRMTPTMRTRRTTPTTRTRMTRRMVMKMQKMTNVNGKTGVSGLVNAAHSLADVLAVKLVAGPLTTSCLIRAAVDSSVPDGKLKLGPAKKKIVAKMPMMVRMRRTALMMRTRRMTPTMRTRRTTPTTRTRMTRRMVMKMQKMTNVNG